MELKDWLTSVPVGAAKIGLPYLCKSGGDQIGVDTLSTPAVDERTMSCRFLISTDVVDRDKMAVRQEGILTDYYVNNPVVLFGHGMEGIVLPIAMSEDEEGCCTVQKTPEGTYARAYHRPSDKVSSQMFDAVSCGLLRAASVGITPKAVSVAYDSQNNKIPIIDECMLNEWSYCAIGVNQEAVVKSYGKRRNVDERLLEAYAMQCEAVSKILDRGTLDGSSIDPVLRKSFSALRPKRAGAGIGFNFKRGTAMKKSLSSSQVKSMTARQLMKACASMDEYDEATKGVLKAAAGFGDPDPDMKPADTSGAPKPPAPSSPSPTTPVKPESDEADDSPEEESKESDGEKEAEKSADKPEGKDDEVGGESPMGAKALVNAHSEVEQLISKISSSVASVEKDEVLTGVNRVIESLRDIKTEIEGIYSRVYKDLEPLGGDGEPEPSDELMKSFLVKEPRAKSIVDGIKARLRAIGNNKKLDKAIAKSLVATLGDFERLEKRVNESKQPDPSEELLKKLESLEKSLSSRVGVLDNKPALAPFDSAPGGAS